MNKKNKYRKIRKKQYKIRNYLDFSSAFLMIKCENNIVYGNVKKEGVGKTKAGSKKWKRE